MYKAHLFYKMPLLDIYRVYTLICFAFVMLYLANFYLFVLICSLKPKILLHEHKNKKRHPLKLVL